MTPTIDKLKDMNLPEDTVVTLTYSEGVDVFVHNETEVETALSETDVVSTFAELIATRGLDATTAYGTSVLGILRENSLLDDYERGSLGFADYIAEIIDDNFHDVDLIEYSTEKYDYKRGFTTLTANIRVPLKQLIATCPHIGAWEVSVKTEDGTLMLG